MAKSRDMTDGKLLAAENPAGIPSLPTSSYVEHLTYGGSRLDVEFHGWKGPELPKKTSILAGVAEVVANPRNEGKIFGGGGGGLIVGCGVTILIGGFTADGAWAAPDWSGWIIFAVLAVLAILGGLLGLGVWLEFPSPPKVYLEEGTALSVHKAVEAYQASSQRSRDRKTLKSVLVEAEKCNTALRNKRIAERWNLALRTTQDQTELVTPALGSIRQREAGIPLSYADAEVTLSWAGAVALHNQVKTEYGTFLSSPLDVFSYPLLSSGTLSELTARFEDALIVAEDAKRERDAQRYGKAVLVLNQSWKEASSHAHRAGVSSFSPDSRRTLVKAKKLIALALDDATPTLLAREYLLKAHAMIKPIVTLPETTVNALETVHKHEIAG